ncbi:MAG TPA: hypothetical protein VFH73_06385 [Polyangia bacterium]|nr:hypothetical protein [Polyangia bacterium]
MTMSRFESLARRLVLFLGLGVTGVVAAGCQAGPTVVTMPATPAPAPAGAGEPSNPTPATTPPASPATQVALETDVAEHLARLQALQTVAVGKLVVSLPCQAASNYGTCPDDVYADMVREAYARQAPRLARLTELAETIARAEVAPVDPTVAVDDLAALNRLAIVDVQGLLTVAPVYTGHCYGACPADKDRADAENQRRAGVVHDLAREAAAQKL